jgi:MFS family permease
VDPGDARDRQALGRWRNAVIAAFGLGGLTVATWGPRLPAVKAELRVGTATIGLILACATIGAVGGLVASTPLLTRLGGRRAVMTALLVIAVALAVMGAAITLRSVPLVAAGFAVAGFGIGTLDVLINVQGSAVERAAGRTLLPLMHGGWSVGAAAGAAIGAACAAAGITPTRQFAGLAIVIAILSPVISRAIPAAALPADQEEPREKRPARIREWLRGWADARLLIIGVVMLGVELGEGSANNWLTLAAKDDHGQSSAIAALFFTVFAASEAATRIFGGPAVDRLGRVRTIRYTTALGIIGVLLFILSGSMLLILIGVVFWAAGVSMGFPLGMSAAADGGGNPAARVSVVASIGYFANLAGPPVLGFLAESFGLLGAFWLIVILLAASFAGAGALRPAGPAPLARPQPSTQPGE